jgi:hypothetical protein
MFQFAAGLAIREHWGADVVLDATLCHLPSAEHPRPFGLGAFSQNVQTYRPMGVDALVWRWLTSRRISSRFRDGVCRLMRLTLVDEQRTAAPAVPASPGGRRASLYGYWQHPSYFAGLEGRVRESFQFRLPPSGRNALAIEEIRKRPSIAVHVRRGDYATGHDRTLRPDYYKEALAVIEARVPGGHYYFFSDEPEWVKAQAFLPERCTVVDWNDESHPEEDLRMMSACRHHVIANSTLSWWAAWLASNPGQVVVAPRRWTGCGPMTISPLILSEWAAL